MKHLYNAPTIEIALEDFANKWESKYSYAIKSWKDNWDDIKTFLVYL